MEPTTVDTVFCLPLNVPVYTISYFGYTWGLYRRGEAVMYVTRGLGEMFPRIYCRGRW